MAGEFQSFGEFFKSLRKKRRVTLRDFCLQAKADPANISRMERGAMPPPQDTDILERYAEALGVKSGSDDWYIFFDLAAAGRGIIPKDLLSNQEVVKMLPAFFRTLRGQKPTEEEMKKLIEKIRKS
jgi:transcriptional regulator with XRE-family HTH domain